MDLSRYQRRNITSPGTYSVDVLVNDNWHGRMNLSFKAWPGKEEALACFDNALLERLGLISASSARRRNSSCLPSIPASPGRRT
nr:hypothetical protein [Pseudomonas sp. BIGb0427]